jgi:hypothetical protein
MPALVIPRVHLNGTSRGELLKQLVDAQDAVLAAITAVGNALPHGRDYDVINDDAIDIARSHHRTRITMLEQVLAELQVLSAGVAAQGRGEP